MTAAKSPSKPCKGSGFRRKSARGRQVLKSDHRLAGLRKPYHKPYRAGVSDRPAGIEAFPAQRAGLQQGFGNAQASRGAAFRRLQFCAPTSHARDNSSRSGGARRKAVEFRTSRGND